MNRRHALRWLLAPGAAVATYRGVPASAQEADMHTIHQLYGIETFCMFRRMMLSGDFTSKVALDTVMAKRPTVGAVADARGEIMIYDGKLIVSYGKSAPPIELAAERAALLATGTASAWKTITIEHDVAPEGIEAFRAAAARLATRRKTLHRANPGAKYSGKHLIYFKKIHWHDICFATALLPP